MRALAYRCKASERGVSKGRSRCLIEVEGQLQGERQSNGIEVMIAHKIQQPIHGGGPQAMRKPATEKSSKGGKE